jgi:hypothetical protein
MRRGEADTARTTAKAAKDERLRPLTVALSCPRWVNLDQIGRSVPCPLSTRSRTNCGHHRCPVGAAITVAIGYVRHSRGRAPRRMSFRSARKIATIRPENHVLGDDIRRQRNIKAMRTITLAQHNALRAAPLCCERRKKLEIRCPSHERIKGVDRPPREGAASTSSPPHHQIAAACPIPPNARPRPPADEENDPNMLNSKIYTRRRPHHHATS